ncbi:MAG: tetratricopeptide repeat protein [Erythrobacter sp.]|nr:tetratricopeptide repeat protein [Erythrobacter sp.]
MNAKLKRNPMIGLGLTTAMAAVLLTGCATGAAPRAEVSASQAQQAMVRGQTSQAVAHAEAAVAADPRNASYRMVLGNAYLNEGRFASASTTFADAMALGENSPRAALSYALALAGEGRFAESAGVLNQWEGQIAAGDLGLAYALAGQPERGIHVLTNAIRQGDNTVKTRQNLAYAYAVAGRWRDARVMASQDIPADQVGDRMDQWAQLAAAEAYQQRVAGLLSVPAGVYDAGQPAQLALANFPSDVELAADSHAYDAVQPAPQVAMAAPAGELPAMSGSRDVGLDTYEAPAPAAAAAPAEAPTSFAPTNFAEAFGTPLRPVAEAPAPQQARAPIAQPIPALQVAASAQRETTPRPVPRRAVADSDDSAGLAAAASAADGTHLIQLGSFSSEAGARRAWSIYVSRHPALAQHEMVITEAVVRGRRYWRVSAGGFDVASSRAMCRTVNSSSGDGCISWAANSPLPGAVETGVLFARR